MLMTLKAFLRCCSQRVATITLTCHALGVMQPTITLFVVAGVIYPMVY